MKTGKARRKFKTTYASEKYTLLRVITFLAVFNAL